MPLLGYAEQASLHYVNKRAFICEGELPLSSFSSSDPIVVLKTLLWTRGGCGAFVCVLSIIFLLFFFFFKYSLSHLIGFLTLRNMAGVEKAGVLTQSVLQIPSGSKC